MTKETHHSGPITAFLGRSATLEAQPESSHTEHVFSYLSAGTVQLEHGGPVTVAAGTVTVVPAGVPHRILGGQDVEIWIVTFCAGCLSLDEHQLLMGPFQRSRRGALPVIQIPEDRRDRLVRHLKDLQEELEHNDATSYELSRCLLLLLLGEVQRAQKQFPESIEGSLVSEALAFIQRRCFEPISLKDVAAAVHRSPAHVATKVKEATGYTVGQWIASGRVAEAASRLAHTDDRIDEIAGHVGWQDTTHFIRQFKKAYGATPAAWRKAHRAGHTPSKPGSLSSG